MSRSVQDAAQRMIEAVNTIVGWQLETTTWLKRTLVVRHDQAAGQPVLTSLCFSSLALLYPCYLYFQTEHQFMIFCLGTRSVDASPSVEMNTPLNTPMTASLAPSEQSSMRGSTLSLINRRVELFDQFQIIVMSRYFNCFRPSSIDIVTGAHLPLQTDKKSSSNLRGSVKDPNNNKRDPAHSTQALFLLAEVSFEGRLANNRLEQSVFQNLTELVDCVCKSDDKDRLLPTLHSVWNNVAPYLKAKKQA